MPVVPFRHNLIKIGKRQYRNPIYVAKGWRTALDNGEYVSPAAPGRHLKFSRARVTQILNLLKLAPEDIEILSSPGDPFGSLKVSERRLRPLLFLSTVQQMANIKNMLSKVKHK